MRPIYGDIYAGFLARLMCSFRSFSLCFWAFSETFSSGAPASSESSWSTNLRFAPAGFANCLCSCFFSDAEILSSSESLSMIPSGRSSFFSPATRLGGLYCARNAWTGQRTAIDAGLSAGLMARFNSLRVTHFDGLGPSLDDFARTPDC